MHIVILDAHTTNPGDLSWEALKALGNVEEYERTEEEELEARIKNADILITNKTPLKAEHFELAPKLKGVSVLASGYDVVDTKAAAERNISVSNVPGYSTESVAQHVFALLLTYSNRICDHNKAVKTGKWSGYPDFSMQLGSINELKGKTIGILGFGTIGKEVALIAQAFGMRVLFYSRNKQCMIINDTHQVDFDTLLG